MQMLPWSSEKEVSEKNIPPSIICSREGVIKEAKEYHTY